MLNWIAKWFSNEEEQSLKVLKTAYMRVEANSMVDADAFITNALKLHKGQELVVEVLVDGKRIARLEMFE